MTPEILKSFTDAVDADTAAAVALDPVSPKADKMWQFKDSLKALCRSFAASESIELRLVIDGLAIAAGEFSAKLNMAKAEAERQVVAENAAAVATKLAAMVIE